MARLNIERQIKLEPLRMEYAKRQISALRYDVSEHSENELRFSHKGKIVKFFPYSGWATGATIKDGRGLRKLLNQINHQSNE